MSRLTGGGRDGTSGGLALMNTSPLVSVLMPVRNEAPYIGRSLGAVLAQDYPRDRLEVIVADGMSTDGTRDAVRSLQAAHSNLRLIDNPGLIVSTGLNRGLVESKGDVIVWVGGHTEVTPDYVSRCVRYLQDGNWSCVGGTIETVASSLVGEAIALAMSTPFGVGGVAFRVGSNRPVETDTVAFGAYWRSAMERCGPLDEELVRNQDDEYNYRLRKLGGRILLAPDIRSRYYSRGTIPSLWRQYFQYGYWKVRVMQKHPFQMRPRQYAPPAFVGALLILAMPSPFTLRAGRLLRTLCTLYALANIAASFHSARRGWMHLPLLPVVFATLHISYGLGFLVGLVKFWHRWGDESTQVCASGNHSTISEVNFKFV